MSASRRDFLILSAGSLASLALAPSLALAARAQSPLRFLILGGTGFLGPHCVDAALARGHHVTLFNRGRTEKRTGKTFDEQPNVVKLHGNRDPEKTADEAAEEAPDNPKGLAQLAEGEWDAVIDTSGYYPRIVRASAELLAPRVKHYTFISSLSAYAANDSAGDDESAAVATMPDPTVENMGTQFEFYGPLKALCEQAAEAAMPGRVNNIRPGYIVGPLDPTDRFTYWPVRASRGGEILAPGTPEDPVMWIDARDLAEWIVLAAERNVAGVFNAIGPAGGAAMSGLLEACRQAAGVDSSLTWVPADFQAANGLPPGTLPIWLPASGEFAGFHTRSNARAVAAGMTFRDALTTCRDTLAWWPQELERRARVTQQMIDDAAAKGQDPPQMPDPSALRAGISAEQESELLRLWHERNG